MNACWIFSLLWLPAVQDGAPAAQTEIAQNPQALIASLGAATFADRHQASQQLRQLTTSDIARLAERAVRTGSAESIVRILAEVDNRYGNASLPEDEQALVSETLETLAAQAAQVPAELSLQSLNLHAQRRASLAMKELRKRGAAIRRGTFQAGIVLGGAARNPPIQIFLDENWKGGLEGIELFSRIVRSDDPAQFTGRDATVYLIDGHTLSAAELNRLRELIGQNRIAQRGRVALGIVGDPVFAPGVIIDRVSSNGSADRAGLRAGDMILAIEVDHQDVLPEEEKKAIPGDEELGTDRSPLADFNDLVERLKKYRAGDTMKLRVIRQYKAAFLFRSLPGDQDDLRQRVPKVEVVSVKLRGWTELGEPAQ